MSTDDDFGRSAFVNCPFDKDYDHILQAVLFCRARFGLKPRIVTERSDAGEPRVSKIVDLVQSSKYSIHDPCYQATISDLAGSDIEAHRGASDG